MRPGIRISILLVLLVGVSAWAYTVYTRTPCDQPIHYRIGRFDDGFGITEAQFKDAIATAATVWEAAAGKRLFVYDPEATFTINLIFDERQQQTLQEERLHDQLVALESNHTEVTAQYKTRLAEYEQAKAAYEQAVAQYEHDLAAFNAKVAQWNKRGGAPSEVYAELDHERAALADRASGLDTDREHVNDLARELNSLGSQGNTIAQQYNQQVGTYNAQFGGTREFNQGEYVGTAINIYEFEHMSDLRVVLAHELGHALSLDHDANTASIMYYLIGEQNMNTLTLTSEDRAELTQVCNLAHTAAQ